MKRRLGDLAIDRRTTTCLMFGCKSAWDLGCKACLGGCLTEGLTERMGEYQNAWADARARVC